MKLVGGTGGSPSSWKYFCLVREIIGGHLINNVESVVEESFRCQRDTGFCDDEPASPSQENQSSSASTSLSSPTPGSSGLSAICSPPAAKKKFSLEEYLKNTANDLKKLVELNEERNQIIEKTRLDNVIFVQEKNNLIKERNELLRQLIQK